MNNIQIALLVVIALLTYRLFTMKSTVDVKKKKEKLTPDLIKVNGKTTKILRNNKGQIKKVKKTK